MNKPLTIQASKLAKQSGEQSLDDGLLLLRFLLGTGRMPHPVGGAMGVTLRHCREKGNTRFEPVSMAVVL